MRKLKRSGCVVLPVVAERRWFDMLALGQAKEAYQDCANHYWRGRISAWCDTAKREGVPMVVEFRASPEPRAERTAFILDALFVRKCPRFLHPDLVEPCGEHYVLRLGERVELLDA